MARIPPLDSEAAGPEARREYEKHLASHERLTNMKRTLGHSPAAFRALMEWYTLRDEVAPFLGLRRADLFSHAISAETDCLICSTFFRRILIDAGENPERLEMDERDRTIVEYGRQIAKDPHQVSDELYARLAAFLSPPQIVALTAFGALMVATNIFNDALRVDLDDYLDRYRKES